MTTNTPAVGELSEREACPICGGDCAGANPPVLYCPMKQPAPTPSPSHWHRKAAEEIASYCGPEINNPHTIAEMAATITNAQPGFVLTEEERSNIENAEWWVRTNSGSTGTDIRRLLAIIDRAIGAKS